MRLLKADCDITFEFEEFYDQNVPPYAILSHTWSKIPTDEVLYLDVIQGKSTEKSAYHKVRSALLQAGADRLGYCWVDTCCIDKSSSAELSEAINSMFRWYANAERCYTFLEDVSINIMANSPDSDIFVQELRKSRWFTRGWTLQELLAPFDVRFYSKEWLHARMSSRVWQQSQSFGNEITFGSKITLSSSLERITGIDKAILEGREEIHRASVAQRMSWAAHRKTSRPEDEAYCLMGLFDVNMPMLYGEGGKAFIRLQEEIIKQSDDETIFAWSFPPDDIKRSTLHGLLAHSPALFAQSGRFLRSPSDILHEPIIGRINEGDRATLTWTMTNRGLSLRLPLSADIAALRCHDPEIVGFVGIRLQKLKHNQYARVDCAHFERVLKPNVEPQQIFVPQFPVEAPSVSLPRRVAILLNEDHFGGIKGLGYDSKLDFMVMGAVFYGDQSSSRSPFEPHWTPIPAVHDAIIVPFAALLFRSPSYETRFILFLGLSQPDRLYFSALETPFVSVLGPLADYSPIDIADWYETGEKLRDSWMPIVESSLRGVSVSAVALDVPGGRCFEIEVAMNMSIKTTSDVQQSDGPTNSEPKSRGLMAKLRNSDRQRKSG